MEEDILMDLDIISAKKTHSNKFNRDLKPKYSSLITKDLDDVEKPQPLTTKEAVKLLLEGKLKSKVCRYCLHITPGLSELDQIMKIGGTGNIYKVTIRDIVASFHPFKVAEDPNFPDKICQKCVDKALGAYLFTQQCEQAERAMLNCFDDMYEKFEKLDPIDRPKKRGRQKLNPNHNILHAEHNRVMDYAEPIINIVNVGAETIRKEPELNELECKKCWQVLPNLESLMNHEKTHPKTMWYHCRLCGKSFPKRNQLKKHNNRFHVPGKELVPIAEKDFKCIECDHVTGNFILHLQHIEKHKFKNVMQHLIEKKMDKLCVVCFNKGTKMMDLDKMVCIHGCHPDLMGDKTAYTLLAATLPNPKSYKYQDLCVPSKAQTMTMSKRQNKYDHQKNTEIESFTKEDITFSYPIIVSRDRFKTDHFYFYVFCDPEQQEDLTINNEHIKEIKDLHKTKLVQVVDIYDENITVSTEEDINIDFEVIEEKESINIDGGDDDDGSERNTKKIDMDIEVADVNLNLPALEFSYPLLENDNDAIPIHTLPVAPQYTFSNPMYELIKQCHKSNELQIIKRTGNNDNEKLTEAFRNKYNIFNKFFDMVFKIIPGAKANPMCNFCWVLNPTGYCDNCKMPIKGMTTNCNHTKIFNTSEEPNEKDLKQKKDRKWQCSVCLVTNADRLTCQCCGAIRFADHKDGKINFGNNKTFLAKKIRDNKSSSLALALAPKEEDIIDPPNNDSIKMTVIEEVSNMDYKSNSEESIEPEPVNIHNMDTEMTAFRTFSGGDTNNNDIEAMDVEETPTLLFGNSNWNNSVLNFNITSISNPVTSFPTVTPTGTNLQFTIGHSAVQQPRKKVRSYKKYTKGFM